LYYYYTWEDLSGILRCCRGLVPR